MTRRPRCSELSQEYRGGKSRRRLVTDGGDTEEEESEEMDKESTAERSDCKEEATTNDSSTVDRSNVDVSDAGESSPADPKWEKPDIEDIPEFELRQDEPARTVESSTAERGDDDPTEGMPNQARSPGSSRIKREGTDGFIAALELAARLPDDIRLPEQAADLVPAAVEAELEQNIQSFAAAEFDNPAPHVDDLAFVERDGEVWLRLRLGIPRDAFVDLDPDEIRSHALQELDGIL